MIIREVLEDYLEGVYRGGTEEEQTEVSQAIREFDNLEKDLVNLCEDNEVMVKGIRKYFKK